MPTTKAAYAAELTAVMERDGVSRAELARRMHTIDSTVGRVLDPADESVRTLSTLSRAAAALGREPAVSLAPERASVLLERHREELQQMTVEHDSRERRGVRLGRAWDGRLGQRPGPRGRHSGGA